MLTPSVRHKDPLNPPLLRVASSNLNGEDVLLSKKDSECESKTSHFTEIKCNLIGRIFYGKINVILWENKCFAIFTKIIEINT